MVLYRILMNFSTYLWIFNLHNFSSIHHVGRYAPFYRLKRKLLYAGLHITRWFHIGRVCNFRFCPFPFPMWPQLLCRFVDEKQHEPWNRNCLVFHTVRYSFSSFIVLCVNGMNRASEFLLITQTKWRKFVAPRTTAYNWSTTTRNDLKFKKPICDARVKPLIDWETNCLRCV